jgi:pimeloyl-ACP methyl ester carboxylesterase
MRLCNSSILALFFLAGCHPLPPGSLDRVQPISKEPRVGTVYLIRGWRDLYSAGIDQLAKDLDQSNVNASVFRAAQWRDLAAALAQAGTDGTHAEPLILVGFSYGADDVLRIAHELQPRGISIDLLITIDPVTPLTVPANVKQCNNYYQPNGIWDIFPWLRGIPLKADNPTTNLLNQNLRSDRNDLLEPNTSHATIASNARLHREIVRQVLAVCRRRAANLYTTAPSRDNATR